MKTTERNGQQAAEAPSPNGTNGHPPAPSPNGENGTSPGANGRAEGGRFAKGNAGGPGNPFARAVGARRSALLDAVSPEDVGRVARRLYEQALAGDVAASKVLLAYVVGRPAEVADPDKLDLEEFRMWLASPDLRQMHAAVCDRVAPGFAAELAQLSSPADMDQWDKRLAKKQEEIEDREMGLDF